MNEQHENYCDGNLDSDEVASLWVFLKERVEYNGKGCGHLLRGETDTRFIHSREWAAANNISVDRMLIFNESSGWMNCDCELLSSIEHKAGILPRNKPKRRRPNWNKHWRKPKSRA